MLHRALIALVLATLVPIALNAQTPQIAKVSALADGRLLLNGKPADIQAIEAELGRVKLSGGVVWYYRQNAKAEPTPQAMSVIALIAEQRLPVSMSTKPDFSDYVNERGESVPRSASPPLGK